MDKKCISYYIDQFHKKKKCYCKKDVNKCGKYIICYMPNFIKKEFEIHFGE